MKTKKKTEKSDTELHTHDCERCGLPYDCGNGSTCELAPVEGYCCQACYDRGPR